MGKWVFLTLSLALFLGPAAARASIIETDVSGRLDPYTGAAYLIPPAFTGDPTTLTSLDFQADVSFSERVQVVGGDGRFTLHYDATMFGRVVASDSAPVVVSGGAYSTSLSFAFAGSAVMADPEVSVAVWLTPDAGYFGSDSAHSISGGVYLRTFYDPPSDAASGVPEPASGWLVSGLLAGALGLGWRMRNVSRPVV